MIEVMNDQRVFLNYGPIQMLLDISSNGLKQPEIAFNVANRVLSQFDDMLDYIEEAKMLSFNSKIPDCYPEVLKKMMLAVRLLGDESYTPLAAVAGAFSEYALEDALEQGAGRVIINNGGDIALRDVEGNPIIVGIPLTDDPNGRRLEISITDNMDIRGICTSGLGGRSFTKGIADKAVAMAHTASVADVCATYIGNQTNVDDKAIIRAYAEEIDSGTDLRGHLVTLKVGKITKESLLRALLNGYEATEALYNSEIIKGGVVVVGENIMVIPDKMAVIKNKEDKNES